MNINNLPSPFDVVTFAPGTYEFVIPSKAKVLYFYTLSAGAGGGSGFTRASGAGGGGGGGSGGVAVSLFYNKAFLPRNIGVAVGRGGAGGTAGAGSVGGLSTIYSLANTNTKTWMYDIILVNYAQAGSVGTVSAGGAAGSTSTPGTSNRYHFYNVGDYFSLQSAGTITAQVNLTIDNWYRPCWGGQGGGGITTGNTPLDGNGIVYGSNSYYFSNTAQLGGLSTSVASATGEKGTDGTTVFTGENYFIPVSTPGTGGGASLTGPGGAGGRGGIGSGGGGGGSGTTGGAGGQGGDGVVIIASW